MRNKGLTSVPNVFTVDVEEYFQVEAFSDLIPKKDWHKFPSRVDESTTRLLELLDRYHVQGTFFVLGWIARNHPALVEKISKSGHEVASHGFDHSMITEMTPETFRQDIRKSKAIIENIIGTTVAGYRAPTFSILEKTSWAYKILLDEGYAYSSSVFPIWHDRYGWPKFGNHPRRMEYNANGEIWEVPMSVGAFGPFRIPFGGGGYLRFYPLPLTEALFRCMGEKGKSAILYVHPWELDVAHPHVQAPLSRRLRHYFGIRRMEKKLVILLQSLKFDTASNVLKSIMKSL
jgi:polysaccharide deacetylase family protein (PEP-CTERM system associated)